MLKLSVILPSALLLAFTGLACSSDPAAERSTGGSSGSGGAAAGGNAGAGGLASGGAGGNAGAANGGTNQGGSAGSGAGGAGGSSGSGGSAGSGGQAATKTFVYVAGGEYSEGTGKLRVFELNEESAALSPVEEVTVGSMNSFVAFHPTLSVLYAGDEQGKVLRAYSIDPATGKLTFVNEAATVGGPVYVSIDKTGKFAFTSFYNEGSVEVFSLEASGAIGTSVDTENTGANAHSIQVDPTNAFAFVPNKGSNTVSQFAFNATSGALTANTPPSAACTGGPRHLAFSATGDFAYVIAELEATISTFTYDDAAGTLSLVETIPATAANFSGNKQAADIHITPDGKFLYGTNRATTDSTIGMYSIGADGKLTNLGFENTHGSSPRNFAIHPSGKLLLVGNHDSDNVASFRILDDGKLEFIETTAVNDAFWVGFRVVPE